MTSIAHWPALVLCAGLGTRLRPLSSVRAKPALPIGGEPLVRRILRGLAVAGVRRAVVNLHHLPETLTSVVGDGRDLGLPVQYSWEPVLLGSAGGPRRARPILDAERFLIVNGDTLTDVDLVALADAHTKSGALVTLSVTRGDVARYGGVRVLPDGRVAGFAAAAPQGPVPLDGTSAVPAEEICHFVGVQAVEACVFDPVPDDRPSETVRWLYPSLLAAEPRRIRAFWSQATFLDIGTPADYLAAAQAHAAGANRNEIGTGVSLAADARVEGCVLWNGAVVEAGAYLRDCIVTDAVRVPAGAQFNRQILTQGAGGLTALPIQPAAR